MGELRLFSDTVLVTPIPKTWDSETWEPAVGDVPGSWNFWEVSSPDEGDEATCNECQQGIFYKDGEWLHADYDLADDEDTVQDRWDHDAEVDQVLWNDEHGDRNEGPMMNYWYPLNERGSFDPEYAARILAEHNLPLCVVEVEGEYGLALTGGGMDLSWEIAEAFARLGYCPPLHFCDLPRMAGRERYESTPYVVAACARSAEIAKGWAERTEADLAKLAADYGIEIGGDQ